jgi:hypothetical protein
MYIGPDTLFPISSAAAAIGGFILMFWRQLKGAAKRGVQAVRKKAPDSSQQG